MNKPIESWATPDAPVVLAFPTIMDGMVLRWYQRGRRHRR
jgi:hypothetical protein